MFNKGDKVQDIYTKEIFTVKRAYWQNYAGGSTADWTVEFEPTATQPTPWNKGSNLVLYQEPVKNKSRRGSCLPCMLTAVAIVAGVLWGVIAIARKLGAIGSLKLVFGVLVFIGFAVTCEKIHDYFKHKW